MQKVGFLKQDKNPQSNEYAENSIFWQVGSTFIWRYKSPDLHDVGQRH